MNKLLKFKSERGATGVDISTSILIFIVFSSLAFAMFWATYKYVYDIQMHEHLVGYATEICEKIDLYSYDTPIEQIVSEVDIPNQFMIRNISEEKYIDTVDPETHKDIVKKISMDFAYNTASGEEVKFTVSKIKIKER